LLRYAIQFGEERFAAGCASRGKHGPRSVADPNQVRRLDGAQESDVPADAEDQVDGLPQPGGEEFQVGVTEVVESPRPRDIGRRSSQRRAREIRAGIVLDGESPVHQHGEQPMRRRRGDS
jgi:hypothetical protein